MAEGKGEKGGITNNQGRSILGTGGVQNTHHEGPIKRPTETATENKKKRVKKTGSRTYLGDDGKVHTETYEYWAEE